MSEIEIIQYGHIHGLSLFLNCVEYRTPHLHPEWELIWILDGILSVRVEDSEYSMDKGSLVLFPPGMVHEFNAKTPDSTFLCLQMMPEFLNIPESVTCSSMFPADFLGEEKILKAKRMLLEIALSYFKRPSLFQMFCAGECNLLMHDLLGSMPVKTLSSEELLIQRRKNERLNRLIEYVEDHYAEKIKLGDFALEEGVSMNYLSHFIKDSLNQSFQSYVSLVRFHAACKLISTQKYRMTEVYKLVGFSDYKYFSNSFKAHCGLTPEEFSRSAISNKFSPAEERILNPHSNEKRLSVNESLDFITRIEETIKK